MSRPSPNPPPRRNYSTKLFGAVSIFELVGAIRVCRDFFCGEMSVAALGHQSDRNFCLALKGNLFGAARNSRCSYPLPHTTNYIPMKVRVRVTPNIPFLARNPHYFIIGNRGDGM